MNKKNGKLVWIDLEMTGLDLFEDKIIEVAALVTDYDLNILDEEGFREVIKLDSSSIAKMIDEVREMHTENGLIDECRLSNTTLFEAEESLIAYLRQFVYENSAPLCGNSIATDRAFIMAQMKDLESFLYYKNIDVSAFKQIVNIKMPEQNVKKPESDHRALSDIKASIEEMKYYVELLFH